MGVVFDKLFGRASPGQTQTAPARAPRARVPATFAGRLTFEAVSRRFGDKVALSNVSLDVAPGEMVCLLGPSGCGKTTLLRIASGVDWPTSGRVCIDRREVAGPDRFVPPERRNIGLMFQDFALFPHMSIVDNVAFGLKALPRVQALDEAHQLLTRVGLAEYAQAYPDVLSGGQQQRVALARAIAPRPSLVLMDEPFSGLDVQLRDTMQAQTAQLLKETRATSVMVTHDPVEAMRMGDRVAVMRDGQLIQVGAAEELYHAPADLFVARLFSEINEMTATVRGGQVETPIGRFDANGLRDGQSAILCIRRRAVRVAMTGEGLAGRIMATKFQGDLAVLDVAVQGMDTRLRSLIRERDAMSPGTDVRVTVDPLGVMVFAAER